MYIVTTTDGDVDTKLFCREVKRRGFLPHYYHVESTSSSSEGSNITYVLSLSPRLFVKLLVQCDLPLMKMAEASNEVMCEVCAAAIPIIQRTSLTSAVWIARSLSAATATPAVTAAPFPLSAAGVLYQLSDIFIQHCAISTHLPASLGILCYFLLPSNSAYTAVYIMIVFMIAVLSACLWRRKEAVIVEEAGRADTSMLIEGRELTQIASQLRSAPPSITSSTYPILSYVGVVAILAAVLRVMLIYVHYARMTTVPTYVATALPYFSPDAVYHTLLALLYTAITIAISMTNKPISALLTDMQKHCTKSESHRWQTLVELCISFTARYSAIIYLSIPSPAYSSVPIAALAASQLILFTVYDNASKYGALRTKRGTKAGRGVILLQDADNSSAADTKMNELYASLVKAELDLSFATPAVCDAEKDAHNMLMQYGLVFLAACHCALIPAVFVGCKYIYSTTAYHVRLHCRLPMRRDDNSLRSAANGLPLLLLLQLLSTCTRCHQLGFTDFGQVISTADPQLAGAFLLWSFGLLGIAVAYLMLESPPQRVRDLQIMRKYTQHQTKLQQRLRTLDPSTLSTSAISTATTTPIATTLTIAHSHANVLLPLLLSPPFLQAAGVPFYYYAIPLALVLGYMRAEKLRSDRHTAVGVVSDHEVLSHVLGSEMPSYIRNTSVHRVEWINDILQQLWPYISRATETSTKAALQPLLNQYKPSYLTHLELSRLTLGRIAPSVVGIEVSDNGTAGIRLDMEVKWAGNPQVTLEVGYKAVPLTLELSSITLSANVRIELCELTPAFPCFKYITVTCMHKPVLDFAFKVGAINVMNIGAAEYNVAAIVNNLLRSILSTVLLYPKKIVVPMVPAADLEVAPPVPVGLLQLTIKSGRKLKIADLRTSDPYVEIHFMDTIMKTAVQHKTLNPTWNEHFDIMIFDKNTQFVELHVYDYDFGSPSDFLGRCTIKLDNLPVGDTIDLDLPLLDVDTGTVQVTAHFISLQKKKSHYQSDVNEDILFDMAEESLTSDVLRRDVAVSPNRRALLSRAVSGLRFGVLTVRNLRCKNIKSSSMLSNDVRPYVKCSIGSDVKCTQPQRGEMDPLFQEVFHFVVRDATAAQLVLQVFDQCTYTKDFLVGEVSIQVLEAVNGNYSSTENEFLLSGRNEQCSIACGIEWIGAA